MSTPPEAQHDKAKRLLAELRSWADEGGFRPEYIGAALFFLLVASILFSYFATFRRLSTSPDRWGVFGDYVGGTLNPLISMIGLIAVVLTLRYNSQALQHSVRAIEDQQEVIRLQKEQLALELGRDRQGEWHRVDQRMMDLAILFRGKEFHEQRRDGWSFAEMIMPALKVDRSLWNPDYSDEGPEDDDARHAEYLRLSRIILAFAAEWYGHWGQGRMAEAREAARALIERAKGKNPGTSVADLDDLLALSRSFAHVMAIFALYAAMYCKEGEGPHRDYLGNAWFFWGKVALPFRDAIRADRAGVRREDAVPSEFWEEMIGEYERKFSGRGGPGTAP